MPTTWLLLIGNLVAGGGAFLYYLFGGDRKAAAATITLLKEQVGALQLKVNHLTEQQSLADREMTGLLARNAQLTELVTSAGAIERLVATVGEDRVLQREERHRILNALAGLTGMTELLFEKQVGRLPRHADVGAPRTAPAETL